MAKSKKSVTKEAGEDAKAKAIEKMKKAQQKVESEQQETVKEHEEIKKAATKSKKKQKSDKKEAISDDEGVIMLRQVKVYSPYQVYFDNPAYSVTAVNGTGQFDVLPGHKNFLSLLLPGEVTVRTKRDDEKLKIDRGIMHVSDDSVTVFLDV